jgi:alpha-1,6-mannosyltransferase
VGAPAVVHGAQHDYRPDGTTSTALSAWAAVGTVGSIGMVLTGTRIGSVPVPGAGHPAWWFSIPAGGKSFVSVAFYVSLAVVVVAWAGIGRQAFAGRLTTGWAWRILFLWSLPLFLGPPLFSRDIYSYIAQGFIAHRGLDPYSVGPSVLGPGPLLSSVAEVWRATSSPYGPLFVVVTRPLAIVSGSSVIAEVLVFRTLELIGVVLTMIFLPRLARHLGTSPGIALWLGALSPLALFSFVSSGHNDALMVGLLVAGVALAVEGRMVPGLMLCALAATVKLPAAAAVVFLAADHVHAGRGTTRWREVVPPVLAAAAVFVGVSVASGYGFAWLGPGALHVPTELRVASTPAVSLGRSAFHVLHAVGLPVVEEATVTVTQVVCGVVAGLALVWLVATVHRHEVVRSLGLAFMLIVVGSPTVWPWYLMWGMALLAATTAQRSRVLAVTAGLGMVVVGAGGTPELNGSWYVVVAVAVLAAVYWLARDRHWRTVVVGHAV